MCQAMVQNKLLFLWDNKLLTTLCPHLYLLPRANLDSAPVDFLLQCLLQVSPDKHRRNAL